MTGVAARPLHGVLPDRLLSRSEGNGLRRFKPPIWVGDSDAELELLHSAPPDHGGIT